MCFLSFIYIIYLSLYDYFNDMFWNGGFFKRKVERPLGVWNLFLCAHVAAQGGCDVISARDSPGPTSGYSLLPGTPLPAHALHSGPTLYSVHCTLYFVHCTLHTAYFTLYTVHLTHWTLYFVRVTLFIAKFSVRLHWHCFKCHCLVESFSPPGKGRLCLPDTIGTHFSVNLARPLYVEEGFGLGSC